MYKNIFLLSFIISFTYFIDFYAQNTLISKNIHSAKTLNVHDDFIISFNPSIINQKYSEKYIMNDSQVQKIILPVNFKFISKDIKNKKISEYDDTNFSEYDYTNLVDFSAIEWKGKYSDKKKEFIKTLLPLIVYENQKIIIERQKIIEIKNFLELKKTLSEKNIKYLNQISKKYKVSQKNKHKVDLLEELLINVNIIPNSIVLAQAINESGWGTSRFAKEYNALFGQYTYDINSGVVPFERENGKKHLIKNFNSIEKSVESYFNNINSHNAYKNFRKMRNNFSKKNINKNIKLLTKNLQVYAEDENYVNTLNSIIDSNNLNQFDYVLQIFIKS